MGDHSAIEWTDATWNPVTGCDKVSPGCAHCYAETWAKRGLGNFAGGRPFADVRWHDDRLEQPLRWRKPRRIFVNSMSDLFHEAVPDAFIDRVFAVMALAPQHTFQVLTKRAARMRDYVDAPERRAAIAYRLGDFVNRRAITWERGAAVAQELTDRSRWPLPNVWLGVSVENRRLRDARVPRLLQTPAAVKFISAEPLLEDIASDEVFSTYFYTGGPGETDRISWVIVGGESGAGARPCEVAWVRRILQQCQAAGVPVFVKQLGADSRDAAAARDDMAGWMPTSNGRRVWRRLTDRKGGDPAEWPADLRGARAFPARARP